MLRVVQRSEAAPPCIDQRSLGALLVHHSKVALLAVIFRLIIGELPRPLVAQVLQVELEDRVVLVNHVAELVAAHFQPRPVAHHGACFELPWQLGHGSRPNHGALHAWRQLSPTLRGPHHGIAGAAFAVHGQAGQLLVQRPDAAHLLQRLPGCRPVCTLVGLGNAVRHQLLPGLQFDRAALPCAASNQWCGVHLAEQPPPPLLLPLLSWQPPCCCCCSSSCAGGQGGL
mmetsp:Transcript_35896/g.101649  ORF Transcript_35896/g.101649 Transcript_35896/m.101649 type:complete len:228 (-) Transcript_35896:606-1289(-)